MTEGKIGGGTRCDSDVETRPRGRPRTPETDRRILDVTFRLLL